MSAMSIGFAPHFSPHARTLILGSMPGKASLGAARYYAHPRNAFWPIMAAIFEFSPELPYQQRLQELRRHGIALWDVVHRCQRPGSLDSAIVRDSVEPNDFAWLFAQCLGINKVCFNGQAAGDFYRRLVIPDVAVAAEPRLVTLPSTSPAHASLTLAEKTIRWRQALLDSQ